MTAAPAVGLRVTYSLPHLCSALIASACCRPALGHHKSGRIWWPRYRLGLQRAPGLCTPSAPPPHSKNQCPAGLHTTPPIPGPFRKAGGKGGSPQEWGSPYGRLLGLTLGGKRGAQPCTVIFQMPSILAFAGWHLARDKPVPPNSCWGSGHQEAGAGDLAALCSVLSRLPSPSVSFGDV